MEVTEDIPKPERDARLYRRITFPNGLEALLISDPSLVRALPIPTLPRVMIMIQSSAAAERSRSVGPRPNPREPRASTDPHHRFTSTGGHEDPGGRRRGSNGRRRRLGRLPRRR